MKIFPSVLFLFSFIGFKFIEVKTQKIAFHINTGDVDDGYGRMNQNYLSELEQYFSQTGRMNEEFLDLSITPTEFPYYEQMAEFPIPPFDPRAEFPLSFDPYGQSTFLPEDLYSSDNGPQIRAKFTDVEIPSDPQTVLKEAIQKFFNESIPLPIVILMNMSLNIPAEFVENMITSAINNFSRMKEENNVQESQSRALMPTTPEKALFSIIQLAESILDIFKRECQKDAYAIMNSIGVVHEFLVKRYSNLLEYKTMNVVSKLNCEKPISPDITEFIAQISLKCSSEDIPSCINKKSKEKLENSMKIALYELEKNSKIIIDNFKDCAEFSPGPICFNLMKDIKDLIKHILDARSDHFAEFSIILLEDSKCIKNKVDKATIRLNNIDQSNKETL